MKSSLTLKIAAVAAVVMVSVIFTGCATTPKGGSAKTSSIVLPEKYNTPDGMVLGTDNNIYVNIPNFNDDAFPAKIIRITPDDKIVEVCTLPNHPETGKCGPLGIEMGPDGNLYVCDNQSMCGFDDYKSRLLRVNMQDGEATSVDVLVTGFIQANAVSIHNGWIHVTETSLDLAASPMPSGVYRFHMSEFRGEPITLQKGGTDPHLMVKFYTISEDWRVGANGLGFDADGNMLVCNFGDASLLKFTLNEDGNAMDVSTLAQDNGMKSTDGLKVCPETGEIYIADFVDNAVHKVNPETGAVTTILRCENNNGGANGKLDKPSEVCLRGNKVYVSNIDLPFDNNEYDAPHTISVITLPK